MLPPWQAREPQPATPPAQKLQPDALGMIEPKRWAYDGCKRREMVFDVALRPPRVVRKVGWHHCLKCRKPFFSEDVIRLRLCDGAYGCREHEDRYSVLK